MLHTAVPVDPVIVAVNCNVPPTPTELDGALIEIEGGAINVIIAVALTELFVESVAVITTLELEGIESGAV